jgi:hypothetical protein
MPGRTVKARDNFPGGTITMANGPRNTSAPPLAEDLLRLACASRALLEQRPDLRGMRREELAELTLRQIERDQLSPEVLTSFSPRCAYFRSQVAAVADQKAQQQLGGAEIALDLSNALPAALSGLSLSPSYRALAAEQLLSLTDQNANNFSRLVGGPEAEPHSSRKEPPHYPTRR